MSEPAWKVDAKRRYYVSLPAKTKLLRELGKDLAAFPDDLHRDALHSAFHRIHGSAGSYDCDELGRIAAEGERLTCEDLTAPVLERIRGTIDAFDAEVQRLISEGPETLHRARILIVEDDDVTATLLQEILEREGLSTQRAATHGEAVAAIELAPPQAAIIDLTLGSTSALDLLDRVWPRAVPMIVISADKAFETKLEAVRRGCAAYFTKPVEWEELVRKVRAVLEPGLQVRGSRILIVEDDPDQIAYLTPILERAGHTVAPCNDVATVEERLASFDPDLIILDVKLPIASGHDIARYLRQQERYAAVPILFLTALEGSGVETQAIAAGGDDFLRKPVSPEMLLTSVDSRLLRAGRLKTMLERDPLTGLLTHRSLVERIANTVALKQRNASLVFSLVMIDVDFFKRVNDTYGHLTGDHVLSSLGSFLLHHLRGTDLVGRYGGEEFGVILAAPPEQAVEVMRNLLREFSAVTHRSDDGVEFHVSFTAGVAGLEALMSAEEWKLTADRALLEGKRAGRKQVILAQRDESLFDDAVLAPLRELEKRSGVPIIAELTTLFLETLPQRVESMQRGLAAGDAKAIEHAAHAFRSASGNIGARNLAALCGELETAAARGLVDEALVGKVLSESARVQQALRV